MADSGESTATFGCRSDSTTAGACPAAEADVSISDIEVAPEMNTDPEIKSGVTTDVESERPKGIKRFAIRTKGGPGTPGALTPKPTMSPDP